MSKSKSVWLAIAGVLLLARAAGAAEFTVLSGGAIEPGLKTVAAAFHKETGHTANITFNTAPQIRKRLEGGERWDVVIAPPSAIENLAATGKFAEERIRVGRVGMGVAVRPGAPLPDIASAEALKRSVLDATSLVYNRASTGLYLESLLKKMGVYEKVESKTTRYADGASVMDHVLNGTGTEIGFGAITEILLYRDKGLQLVGPLPAEVQNYTSYTALASHAQAAQTFVRYLGSPPAQALFAAAGIVQ
jgi:molybdate transport system substrate-binding protein